MEDEKQELMARAEMFAKTGSVEKSLSLPTDQIDDDALRQTFDDEQLPDIKEQKKIKRKVRKIWDNYRKNALESIDLENYRKYCELQEIKAESDKKLAKLKREKEKEEAEHWLIMHSGHLKEINYNTESKPCGFWYKLNRGIWYLRKTFDNIPKLVWKILLTGIGITALVVLVLLAGRYV